MASILSCSSACSAAFISSASFGSASLVEAVERRLLRREPSDVLPHRLAGIELRLLRQVADAGALGGPGLAAEFVLDPGHDLEQRRLAGAVDAEHADLGARIK